MVIVTGSVRIRPDGLERAIAVSLEHVHRSRQERGCLLHSVHRDVEDDHRLVFLERWSDLDALHEHFAVPASGDFVRQLTELAEDAPEMAIYLAEPAS